jgi:hypothetical protein
VEDADEPVREGAQGLVVGRHFGQPELAAAPGSTTFCGVHTWQVKVDLLATFRYSKDSTHE